MDDEEDDNESKASDDSELGDESSFDEQPDRFKLFGRVAYDDEIMVDFSFGGGNEGGAGTA